MVPSIEELKFGGKVHSVAEDELGASLMGDDSVPDLASRLYAKYVEAGKPKDPKKWIREKLEQIFLCMDNRPVWPSGRPEWPFLDGKPMIFINQIDVDRGAVASSGLSPGTTLLIFGIRVPIAEGWEMKYKVVQDFGELRHVAVVPKGG